MHYRWFVRSKGQLAGTVSLNHFNAKMLTAEVESMIGEDHCGQGLGIVATRELVYREFNETPIRRLIAMIHSENVPSQKLIERVGFRREGTLREHYLIDGKPCDELVYGLLRREHDAKDVC